MTAIEQKRQGSGWVKIQTLQGLRVAIQRMLNKILMDKSSLDLAETFAQLSNAWINSFRAEVALIDMMELEERILALEI